MSRNSIMKKLLSNNRKTYRYKLKRKTLMMKKLIFFKKNCKKYSIKKLEENKNKIKN